MHNMVGVEWEWIVLLNGDARADSRGPKWSPPKNMPQVRVIEHADESRNIGALKRRCCIEATGDVFIELDHDDELLPGCLPWIIKTVSPFSCDTARLFLFSPTHELDGNGQARTYGNAFGWEHATVDGLTYNIPFEVTPRSLCEIFFAPNHVRAWTRAAYMATGGHDANMEVGDDHDLIIRTYLEGAAFLCAPRPLYIQHFHGGNSQHGERNARIQAQQAVTRDKYLTRLIHEWCKREHLAMLDLGGAFGCPEGYIAVDVLRPDSDERHWIKWNVESDGIPSAQRLKSFGAFAGIGCIRAKDFLEHIHQPLVVGVMNSIHHALAPGGWLLSMTPSTDGRGAFQDPTHVSFWNENSFLYYTSQHQSKYVPHITAQFQAVQLGTVFPGEWEKQKNIPYVQANLCALHGQRQPGLIGFPRKSREPATMSIVNGCPPETTQATDQHNTP